MVQLPQIGGFSPLPLAVMAPFMAYQSAELAYAFGLNYEAGKRDIKRMGNEEYNALTPEARMAMVSQHHTVQLQTFLAEMPRTLIIQEKILDEYLKLEKSKIDMNITLAITLIDKLAQQGNSVLSNLFGLFTGDAKPYDPNSDPTKFVPPKKEPVIPPGTTYNAPSTPKVTKPTPAQSKAQAITDALLAESQKPENREYQKYNLERMSKYAQITSLKLHIDQWKLKKSNVAVDIARQKQVRAGNIKSYNKQVSDYYKWLQIHRNSSNIKIKLDAGKRYTKKHFKPIY